MDSARLSNGNSGSVPNFGYFAMPGAIPPFGIFSVKRWAEFFDVDESTIRRWIKEYEIPFLKPGACMFVDAADFIRRLPYFNREE